MFSAHTIIRPIFVTSALAIALSAAVSCAPAREHTVHPPQAYGQEKLDTPEPAAATPAPTTAPTPAPAPVGGKQAEEPPSAKQPAGKAETPVEPTKTVEPGPKLLMAVVHFDFDRAIIRADDKRLLDQLLTSLDGFQEISRIRVTGYADRFGSDSYNIRLSKRRAVAVENYLLRQSASLMSHPLKPMLMEIFAKGKSEPTTNCPTSDSRDAQIQCLQPDRRAEVDVEVGIPAPSLL